MKMLEYFEVSDEIQLNRGNVGVFLGVQLSMSDISENTCITRMSVYFEVSDRDKRVYLEVSDETILQRLVYFVVSDRDKLAYFDVSDEIPLNYENISVFWSVWQRQASVFRGFRWNTFALWKLEYFEVSDRDNRVYLEVSDEIHLDFENMSVFLSVSQK